MIESEKDLHYKIVSFIRDKYPEALLIAGLGELQTTSYLRCDAYNKGYSSGQCDLMLMNPTRLYTSLCIEFKSPTGKYQVSEAQLNMKEKYERSRCKYILSNSYEDLIHEITIYMEESNRYLKRRVKRQII